MTAAAGPPVGVLGGVVPAMRILDRQSDIVTCLEFYVGYPSGVELSFAFRSATEPALEPRVDSMSRLAQSTTLSKMATYAVARDCSTAAEAVSLRFIEARASRTTARAVCWVAPLPSGTLEVECDWTFIGIARFSFRIPGDDLQGAVKRSIRLW